MAATLFCVRFALGKLGACALMGIKLELVWHRVSLDFGSQTVYGFSEIAQAYVFMWESF